jgi:hypothetical protein
VREIAVQRLGGIAGNNSAIPLTESNNGFAELRLFWSQGGNLQEADFLAVDQLFQRFPIDSFAVHLYMIAHSTFKHSSRSRPLKLSM